MNKLSNRGEFDELKSIYIDLIASPAGVNVTVVLKKKGFVMDKRSYFCEFKVTAPYEGNASEVLPRYTTADLIKLGFNKRAILELNHRLVRILGLPVDFCNAYLPKQDEQMTLFDEEGNETLAKYLADKRGLSGGWRGFALNHEIADGDACVLQLIKPKEFKVYIIRLYEQEDNEEDSKVAQPEPVSQRVRRSLEDK